MKEVIKIAILGKYTEINDSYISVFEAVKHAGWELNAIIEPTLINAEDFEQDKNNVNRLSKFDGLIVPGGFGHRGANGIMTGIKFARENNIPFLGICLGFQLAVVEFSRNVLGIRNANSTEIDIKTEFPIVDLLPEQKNKNNKGGTMRLGAYSIKLKEGTMIKKLYKSFEISERHRHRYEINPELIDQIEGKELKFTGYWNNLAEALELSDHPYFIATQFHPEFKSNPWKPSPPYFGLIEAIFKLKSKKIEPFAQN